MSNNISGVKISPDEYFPRQKEAEQACKRKIEKAILQSFGFAAITVIFYLITWVERSFIIVWVLFICINAAMSIGSLFLIPRAIKYYKYSLERIVEYMLSGGIIIEIPKEDYEKFDLIKSRKKRYRQKSIQKMQKEETKRNTERQQREEYERKVEEDFQKQFYPDETEK